MNQFRQKNLLLIGGKGFIGKAIEASFEKEEKWQTVNIDRGEIDLTTEESIDTLKEISGEISPDSVIVLAAIKRQEADGQDTKEANNKITVNINRALENYRNQLIYFSSCAVYGEKNQQLLANERTAIDPTSKYGEHKVFSEKVYADSRVQGDKLLILRPPLVYSENEERGYGPGGFLNSAKTKSQIDLWGDGREMRELIHVRDIAELAKKSVKGNYEGVCNVTSGISYSYFEIANYIKGELAKEKHEIFINQKPRTGVKVDHTYDNNRLKYMAGDYRFITPQEALYKRIAKNRDCS